MYTIKQFWFCSLFSSSSSSPLENYLLVFWVTRALHCNLHDVAPTLASVQLPARPYRVEQGETQKSTWNPGSTGWSFLYSCQGDVRGTSPLLIRLPLFTPDADE